ncbi:MAG: hypothetical protein Q7U70_04095 [Methylotenera sp.]|nr:hypothetical protein [Methylotenera sp.]MDO9390043.1 hypothetical protein [Methylotenera sp.]
MINPTDATIIDSRVAYPIDECVAKMLGWMQGPERLERIKVDERGILPHMLPHISRLVYTLDEHLDQLKERARLELFDAADAYADAPNGTHQKDELSDIIDQKYIAIEDCAELIKKAHFYKSEIRKELEKDNLSQLKIDHVEKDEDGLDIIYIKLDSLDDWAKKYQVNIIDMPETIIDIISQPQAAPSVTLRKSQRDNALSLVLNDILRINPQATTAKVVSELRILAGEKHSVIISIIDEGVKWIGDDGETQITSRDALGERIRYWRKHRLNQD